MVEGITPGALRQYAERVAAAFLDRGPEDVSMEDLTSAFPWLTAHAVFLAEDPDERRALVGVRPDGSTILFPGAMEIEPVNQLLREESIDLPEGLTVVDLADCLRTLLLGAGGFVASEAFWAENQDRLHLWSVYSPGDGPRLFREYCRDPALARQDDQWTLQFFYFGPAGQVEDWRVRGDRETILEARREVPIAPGTFFVPHI